MNAWPAIKTPIRILSILVPTRPLKLQLMKISRHVLLISCFLVSTAGFSQPGTATNSLVTSFADGNGADGIVHYTPLAAQSCPAGDSLQTTYITDNSFDGVMFDVVATNDITVHCFNANLSSGTVDIEIYSRSGTHVGNEMSNVGWTLLGTATGVVSQGTGQATNIPIDVNTTILAGNTMAFYITEIGVASGSPMNYTDGTAVGTILASDANVDILEGAGLEYPFANFFTPRNFNGDMFYTAGPVGIEEELDAVSFQLFPNPANGSVTIMLTERAQGSLSIRDITGKLILDQTVANKMFIELDITDEPRGVYFVTVTSETSSTTKKLVLQ